MHLLRAVAAASGTDNSAAMLAEACGLNRATAWRILSTLETHGMVTSDRESGRWSVGPGLVEIARAAGLDTLLQSAHAVLERLSAQTGETAALAVSGSGELTYVDEVAPSAIVAATWQGRTVPLHATSTGKALLASLPPDEVERVLGGELRRYTPTTITDPGDLRAELAVTRARGYGVCRGEYESSAWGVSAAVLGGLHRPRAVLSIWGPASRVSDADFEGFGALAVQAAAALRGVGV
jgi:DNA-binding IclR family transcriptional regulator